jgi:hypothetical protein
VQPQHLHVPLDRNIEPQRDSFGKRKHLPILRLDVDWRSALSVPLHLEADMAHTRFGQVDVRHCFCVALEREADLLVGAGMADHRCGTVRLDPIDLDVRAT